MLNTDIDVPALKAEYSVDRRVRIDNLLEPALAEEAAQAMQALTYDLILFSGNANRVIPRDQLTALDDASRNELQQELLQLANQGTGFLYGGYRMDAEKKAAAPEILGKLFDAVGNDLLELVREISGIDSLQSADGQFTMYDRGHYLTRHSDAITAEGRRLAYVLSMNEAWHPDWGGLLQFYEQSGVPRDAYEPRFNSLSLFDVSHIHSVTYVTPFAGRARYSLTGWFRD